MTGDERKSHLWTKHQGNPTVILVNRPGDNRWNDESGDEHEKKGLEESHQINLFTGTRRVYETVPDQVRQHINPCQYIQQVTYSRRVLSFVPLTSDRTLGRMIRHVDGKTQEVHLLYEKNKRIPMVRWYVVPLV